MNGDDQDKLSIKELNEKLSALEEILKVQEVIIEKEKNLEKSLIFNILKDDNDKFTLNELAEKLNTFCKQEDALETQNYELKVKIQNHINKHLDELHLYTNYFYHIIIGIILLHLIMHDLIMAILFFVFALFKTLTSKTSNDIELFPGIEIHDETSEPLYIKIFLASAALTGVMIGLILNEFFHISIEIIFLLFSFISGVILYTIIREVLPENESGRPLYFLLGIIIFLIFIITFESINTLFSNGH